MTKQHDSPKQQAYPKKHLIAASGVAAMVSTVLLVFPSTQVEAKKSFIEVPIQEQVKPAAARIALPDPADIALARDTQGPEAVEPEVVAAEPVEPEPVDLARTVHVSVQPGDTLSTIFGKLDLGHSLLMTILEQDKAAKRFTNLKAGQNLVFIFDSEDRLESITSQLSALESIEIARNAETGRYAFERHVQKPTQIETTASGVIESSLLGATQKAGMPHKLALDMAKVFAYDIDFARDVRQGDRFEVIYEQKMLDDQVVGTGNILAARFINKGKELTAVRYTDKNGNTDYYNSDGTSSRRAFIRTPVDFTRISSRFNPGRKHPVLNKIRAHKGVDYAAPTGTPIKATGNGRITFVGTKGGYGKTVIIQHGNTYRTLYGHMNGFAKGMRSGTNVKQGQVIGYVGMTGLATGPHLHYEFHVNGTHVDPLSHKLPTADPIPKAEMARFKQTTQSYLAMLDKHNETQLALADTEQQ